MCLQDINMKSTNCHNIYILNIKLMLEKFTISGTVKKQQQKKKDFQLNIA